MRSRSRSKGSPRTTSEVGRATETSVKTLETIERDLDAAKMAYKDLMEKDVPAFSQTLAGKAMTPLVAAQGWHDRDR